MHFSLYSMCLVLSTIRTDHTIIGLFGYRNIHCIKHRRCDQKLASPVWHAMLVSTLHRHGLDTYSATPLIRRSSTVVLMQRHRADIVNLHHRRGLSNYELKPEIVRPNCGKLDRIICEHAYRIIACIDRINRLPVNLDTDKAFASGAFVKIRPEPKGVRDAGDGGKDLADRRGSRECARGDWSDLIKLIGEVGGVAGRGDGV